MDLFSDTTLEIPGEVPVMTLPNTVLFPQAILPLYIFEPRYREMLRDVLNSNRIFAVAGLNQSNGEEGSPGAPEEDYFEPPFEVATVGVVRASHENEDGTSNLILQGLSRVRFEKILTETPYRRARITALHSSRENPGVDLESERANCLKWIETKMKFSSSEASENFRFLHKIQDPDVFIDLACFSILDETRLKQQLLETSGVESRFKVFLRWLKEDVRKLELDRKLKGRLNDDDILNN